MGFDRRPISYWETFPPVYLSWFCLCSLRLTHGGSTVITPCTGKGKVELSQLWLSFLFCPFFCFVFFCAAFTSPLLPLILAEDKWELRNALQRCHNGGLLWKMKRILVTANEMSDCHCQCGPDVSGNVAEQPVCVHQRSVGAHSSDI